MDRAGELWLASGLASGPGSGLDRNMISLIESLVQHMHVGTPLAIHPPYL
jgi:hypothetical protein